MTEVMEQVIREMADKLAGWFGHPLGYNNEFFYNKAKQLLSDKRILIKGPDQGGKMTNIQVYCSGKNTGCDHEDKPTLEECSDCPYMTTIKPMYGCGTSRAVVDKQDELICRPATNAPKQYELLLTHDEIRHAIPSWIDIGERAETRRGWLDFDFVAQAQLAKVKQHIRADLEPLMAEALDISDWSFVQEYIRNLSEM